MKKRYSLAGAILAGAVVAAGCSAQTADETPQDPNASGERRIVRFFKNPTTAPAFTATDLDGRAVAPARGKVILVNFWATWCGPCRTEIPQLVALQDKYRNQLQIIGVSMDDSPPDFVKRFATDFKINYSIVMKSLEIGKSFPGVFGLPTTFVLDRDSRIVQKHVGLVNPAIFEDETRALAGLPVNASIEQVDDPAVAKLVNAAQATEIPGIDLGKVPTGKKSALLKELNEAQCTCGCGLTVAQCRINDPDCPVSLPLARKIAEKYTN